MSRTYTPGPEADAIVEELLATGNYPGAEEVVRAGLQLLQEQAEMEAPEALELDKLRRAIAEGDAAYARGEYTEYTSAEQFLADIKRLGDEPSPPRG